MKSLLVALALTFAVAAGGIAVLTVQTQPAHAQCSGPRC
jgi:hypothetical protein